jgi:hypothetical protein
MMWSRARFRLPQKKAVWQRILRRQGTTEKADRAEVRAARYIGHLTPPRKLADPPQLGGRPA